MTAENPDMINVPDRLKMAEDSAPSELEQPDLVPGVPSELGGQQVRVAAEADQAAQEQRTAEQNEARAKHLEGLGLSTPPEAGQK